jgi:Domain of unknown function (DUF4296)
MKYLKIKKLYNLFLLLVLVIQCKQSVKLPLNETKMSEVLTDIHLAEAAVDNESGDMKDSITRLYYPQIFEHHGIKQWEFDSTMSILSTNPILMGKIYKKVQAILKEKYPTDTLKQVK